MAACPKSARLRIPGVYSLARANRRQDSTMTHSFIGEMELEGASKPVYVVQTNEGSLLRCIPMTTDPATSSLIRPAVRAPRRMSQSSGAALDYVRHSRVASHAGQAAVDDDRRSTTTVAHTRTKG